MITPVVRAADQACDLSRDQEMHPRGTPWRRRAPLANGRWNWHRMATECTRFARLLLFESFAIQLPALGDNIHRRTRSLAVNHPND
jgi:hypothetical protein